MKKYKICVLGGGKMGKAIANGIVNKKIFDKKELIITQRIPNELELILKSGFNATSDNCEAVKNSDTILISVLPQQLDGLLNEIKKCINPAQHKIISIVTGVTVSDIRKYFGDKISIVRVMPNTAIAIGESMTCIASDKITSPDAVNLAKKIFDAVGETQVIDESQMLAATALCACGIAFFMRAIRAASQGGIEIGFHSEEALKMAAQTAKGAGALLRVHGSHPEHEIDNVTSPRGCTIAGLNQMEHNGFSSAMIKGIVISAEKAGTLYKND
jgi:pyrroline-5-carboxylate reductase